MADQTFDRVVLRGLNVYGIDSSGNETLVYEGEFLGTSLEMADHYASLSGVTFEWYPS